MHTYRGDKVQNGHSKQVQDQEWLELQHHHESGPQTGVHTHYREKVKKYQYDKHFKPLRFRCDTAYRVVEDTLYNEECTVDVKHICEEHINVPTYHMEHGYSQPTDYYPPKYAYYNPSYPYMVKQETYGPPPSATGKPNYGPPSPHPQYPKKPKEFQTRLKRDNNGFQSFSGQYFISMSYDRKSRDQDEKLTEIVCQSLLEEASDL